MKNPIVEAYKQKSTIFFVESQINKTMRTRKFYLINFVIPPALKCFIEISMHIETAGVENYNIECGGAIDAVKNRKIVIFY